MGVNCINLAPENDGGGYSRTFLYLLVQ